MCDILLHTHNNNIKNQTRLCGNQAGYFLSKGAADGNTVRSVVGTPVLDVSYQQYLMLTCPSVVAGVDENGKVTSKVTKTSVNQIEYWAEYNT